MYFQKLPTLLYLSIQELTRICCWASIAVILAVTAAAATAAAVGILLRPVVGCIINTSGGVMACRV